MTLGNAADLFITGVTRNPFVNNHYGNWSRS
jgi:hypothetical protein